MGHMGWRYWQRASRPQKRSPGLPAKMMDAPVGRLALFQLQANLCRTAETSAIPGLVALSAIIMPVRGIFSWDRRPYKQWHAPLNRRLAISAIGCSPPLRPGRWPAVIAEDNNP